MLILYFCSIIAVITAANAGPGAYNIITSVNQFRFLIIIVIFFSILLAESHQDEHSKMVEDLNKLKEIIKERVTNYKASHGKETQSDALQRISNLVQQGIYVMFCLVIA